jgi:hypothetical protein
MTDVNFWVGAGDFGPLARAEIFRRIDPDPTAILAVDEKTPSVTPVATTAE